MKWVRTRVNQHMGFRLGDSLALAWPANEDCTEWYVSIAGALATPVAGTAAKAKRVAREALRELRAKLDEV